MSSHFVANLQISQKLIQSHASEATIHVQCTRIFAEYMANM